MYARDQAWVALQEEGQAIPRATIRRLITGQPRMYRPTWWIHTPDIDLQAEINCTDVCSYYAFTIISSVCMINMINIHSFEKKDVAEEYGCCQ